MKKTKASKIASAVLALLTLVIAVLIIHTYITRKRADATLTAVPSAPSGQGPSAPAGSASPGAAGGAQARSATVVRVRPVELGTIENSVLINGDVLTASEVSIYPTVGGKITEMRLKIGDPVRQGQIAAMVDPSRPGESYSHSPVLSTISGTVLSVPVSIGDTVSAATAVYTVGKLSDLVVETFVPERFASSVRRGLRADVRFEAMPGELFTAAVDEISPVIDPASRTLRIRLRFSQQDSRIIPGMFVSVSLVTQTRTNVPVIPRASVINTYGSWIVFTVDENNIARRREIRLGLEDEEFIEVLEGLEPGDTVVSAGQNFLSDGDPVRIVE